MTVQQFRDVVMPHHRLMAGMAMAVLGDRDDVSDCLRTVRNCALSMLRRANRPETVIPEIIESLDPETRLEHKDRLNKVMEHIESLPAVPAAKIVAQAVPAAKIVARAVPAAHS